MCETPGTAPEILTTPAGPFFIVQNYQEKHLLSALHAYSDTLSVCYINLNFINNHLNNFCHFQVHSMDISLIPLFLYKLPRNCRNVLLTKNLIYTIQTMIESESAKEITPTNEQIFQATADTHDEAKTGENVPKDTFKKSSLGSSSVDIENVISTSSQDETNTSSLNIYNGFGVVSCNMSITKLGDDCVSLSQILPLNVFLKLSILEFIPFLRNSMIVH